MRSKIYFFLFFFIISTSTVCIAQNKVYALKDAYAGRKLYPKNIRQLQWIAQTNSFSYVDNNTLIKGSVDSEKRDSLIKLSEMNDVLNKIGESKLNLFPSVNWINTNTFYFEENQTLYAFDLSTKKIEILAKFHENAENTDISDKTRHVAYTIKNNLYVSIKNKEYTITSDTNKNIVNGKSVHREEFGINKGTFWSPKGNLLAFYRMDQTMVTDYPLVNIESVSNRIAEEELIKYPMAGMKSHHVTLGVYNVSTQKTIFLNTGEPADQYLTNITWSPDEKYIYIQVLNRAQNHLKLNQYDCVSGNLVKTLFEEKNTKYVEPLKPLYFLNTKPEQFIYQSQKDGYNHLYLYNIDGKLIKQITKGKWIVTDFKGTDAKDLKAYYISTTVNPLERHIYAVDLKNNKTVQISSVSGTHNAKVSSDGKYFLANYTSTSNAGEYLLVNHEGKTLQTLLKNENPLKDYKIPEISIFKIKAKDSSDLYCRLIKPIDFDSSKKYPVIIYVYGGPHTQLITNSWLGGAGLFLPYLATKGYLVFTLDNHGSSGRGMEFEQGIFRNLGNIEMEDQLLGVDYLKNLTFVDTTRFGVHGWSYGGFMTITLLLKNPDLFKVAVAGGPVIDWKFYEVMYGERYMDTPEENPLGYDQANLLNYVKNVKNKLLIIHGTSDPTVVWQNSLAFIKKCIDEEKQVDYFVYPQHGHNIMGKDRVHLLQKIENYFNDYLK